MTSAIARFALALSACPVSARCASGAASITSLLGFFAQLVGFRLVDEAGAILHRLRERGHQPRAHRERRRIIFARERIERCLHARLHAGEQLGPRGVERRRRFGVHRSA